MSLYNAMAFNCVISPNKRPLALNMVGGGGLFLGKSGSCDLVCMYDVIRKAKLITHNF